ncbi:MAG: M56 family metallopeptidase [Gemmatimonadota bacterium]
MTIAWVSYVLLVGTLLSVGAYALGELLRRAKLPTRWVWVASLGGVLALALLAPQRDTRVSQLRLPTAINTLSHVVQGRPVAPTFLQTLSAQRDAVVAAVARAIRAADAVVPPVVATGLLLAWLVLTATMLSVVIVVNRRMNRARHRWPRATVHGTDVRIAPGVGPAVIGLVKPEIVVPHWLLERNADEQRLVIVHEREHVRANDQVLPIGAWLVAALLPWHPAVWWSLSRLRLAIELDCDARVLRHGVQARPYGELLIDIAGRCAGHRVGALALADRTSHLERRLLAMKKTRTRFLVARTASLAAIAALAIVAACEARLPTSAEVSTMDVASLEKSAQGQALIGDSVIYKVNGLDASAADARKLKASEIASVEIVKKKTAGSLVLIKTLKDKLASVSSDSTAALEKRLVATKLAADTAEISLKNIGVKIVGPGSSEIQNGNGSLSFRPKSVKTFDGIVLVNGVRSNNIDVLKLMKPDDIEAIEVIKGPAAQAMFANDASAANGIISIKLKAGRTTPF